MLRSTVLLFLILPQLAFSSCIGESFFNRLSPNQLETLDERAQATPFGEGLIWRATKGANEITVIGTMHIYDPRLEIVFAQIRDVIAQADILLLEATDAEEAKLQSAMAEQPELIFITDGPTLPERLEPELWDALAEAARARQIPPFLASKMQPWYLAISLAVPPCAMSDLMAGAKGLGHMIIQEGARNGITMRALEPWDTVFGLMQNDSFEEQIEGLRLSLMSPELHSQMFVAMLDSYFSEQIARLWEASRFATQFVPGMDQSDADQAFEEMEENLLTIRNRNWIPVIEANLQPKTVVAVGAAHLMGDDGVLRLLENRGWAISRN